MGERQKTPVEQAEAVEDMRDWQNALEDQEGKMLVDVERFARVLVSEN